MNDLSKRGDVVATFYSSITPWKPSSDLLPSKDFYPQVPVFFILAKWAGSRVKEDMSRSGKGQAASRNQLRKGNIGTVISWSVS